MGEWQSKHPETAEPPLLRSAKEKGDVSDIRQAWTFPTIARVTRLRGLAQVPFWPDQEDLGDLANKLIERGHLVENERKALMRDMKKKRHSGFCG